MNVRIKLEGDQGRENIEYPTSKKIVVKSSCIESNIEGEISECSPYKAIFLRGFYRIECYGASGVDSDKGSSLGGYTSGIIRFTDEETLYLFGETGTVKIGGTSTNNIDVWDFADETEADAENKGLKEATSNVYGNGHTSLFADVIDAIKNNRQPYVDAKAGRDALELVLAIYKSAAEGKPVKLPLKECSTLDFTGRFDNER